jgi:acyl carrier protein
MKFQEEIKKLIAEKFFVDINSITIETKLSDITEDSIGRIELLFEVEQLLNRKIPEEDVLSMETVADLLHVINKLG